MDFAAAASRMTTLSIIEHHIDELVHAVFDEFPMLEVLFLFLVEIVNSTLAVGHGYLVSIFHTFLAQQSSSFSRVLASSRLGVNFLPRSLPQPSGHIKPQNVAGDDSRA